MVRIVRVEGGRWSGVAATPDLDLFRAVRGRGLGLVEPLERAVVTFVQPPGAFDRHPHLVHLVENDPERADCALEHRGEGAVDLDPLFRQRPAGRPRFFHPGRGQIDVHPTGKAILQVPVALAVAHKD